jgi:hypothetical protein
MFIDEARMTAGSHSNIAQVYDLGEDGDLYIALFVSLDLRVIRAARGAPLPMGLPAMVVRGCLALHYAHLPRPSDEPAGHHTTSPRT